jgi:hypothetical protein
MEQTGHVLAQLVEALHYEAEGRRFDSRWCYWGSIQPPTEMSNQEHFLGVKGGRFVGLTTLQPSCAECLEIWEPQPPGTLRACPGL